MISGPAGGTTHGLPQFGVRQPGSNAILTSFGGDIPLRILGKKRAIGGEMNPLWQCLDGILGDGITARLVL
jgi:hypothetical protein